MKTVGSNENIQSPVERSNLLQQMISPGDVVLDLGSFASGTTQALLSRRCRCYVEDIPVFLNELQVHDNFDFENALRQHLVIANDDVKIDVILTWDLFHYLDLSEIASLFNILEEKIVPGTIIHSTRYMGRDIPERPQLFKLSYDLSYKMLEKKSSLKVPNYSHATIDLLTKLKHFSLNDTLTHSQTFNKGLVEYSLVYSDRRSKIRPVRPMTYEIRNSSETNENQPIELPNLTKLLSKHERQPMNCIIDLGNSLYSNYDQLIRTSEIVLQEDLYASIMWLKKTSIEELSTSPQHFLSLKDSVRLDLVLMWDIANFCQPRELEELIKELSRFMSVGGLLHLVLPHSGLSAEQPARFRINDKYESSYSGNLTGSSGQTVLTTGHIVRLMNGFKVKSYYFGTDEDGSCYQEYLFELMLK